MEQNIRNHVFANYLRSISKEERREILRNIVSSNTKSSSNSKIINQLFNDSYVHLERLPEEEVKKYSRAPDLEDYSDLSVCEECDHESPINSINMSRNNERSINLPLTSFKKSNVSNKIKCSKKFPKETTSKDIVKTISTKDSGKNLETSTDKKKPIFETVGLKLIDIFGDECPENRIPDQKTKSSAPEIGSSTIQKLSKEKEVNKHQKTEDVYLGKLKNILEVTKDKTPISSKQNLCDRRKTGSQSNESDKICNKREERSRSKSKEKETKTPSNKEGKSLSKKVGSKISSNNKEKSVTNSGENKPKTSSRNEGKSLPKQTHISKNRNESCISKKLQTHTETGKILSASYEKTEERLTTSNKESKVPVENGERSTLMTTKSKSDDQIKELQKHEQKTKDIEILSRKEEISSSCNKQPENAESLSSKQKESKSNDRVEVRNQKHELKTCESRTPNKELKNKIEKTSNLDEQSEKNKESKAKNNMKRASSTASGYTQTSKKKEKNNDKQRENLPSSSKKAVTPARGQKEVISITKNRKFNPEISDRLRSRSSDSSKNEEPDTHEDGLLSRSKKSKKDETDTAVTPKKRGRPPMHDKEESSNLAKTKSRPDCGILWQKSREAYDKLRCNEKSFKKRQPSANLNANVSSTSTNQKLKHQSLKDSKKATDSSDCSSPSSPIVQRRMESPTHGERSDLTKNSSETLPKCNKSSITKSDATCESSLDKKTSFSVGKIARYERRKSCLEETDIASGRKTPHLVEKSPSLKRKKSACEESDFASGSSHLSSETKSSHLTKKVSKLCSTDDISNRSNESDTRISNNKTDDTDASESSSSGCAKLSGMAESRSMITINRKTCHEIPNVTLDHSESSSGRRTPSAKRKKCTSEDKDVFLESSNSFSCRKTTDMEDKLSLVTSKRRKSLYEEPSSSGSTLGSSVKLASSGKTTPDLIEELDFLTSSQNLVPSSSVSSKKSITPKNEISIAAKSHSPSNSSRTPSGSQTPCVVCTSSTIPPKRRKSTCDERNISSEFSHAALGRRTPCPLEKSAKASISRRKSTSERNASNIELSCNKSSMNEKLPLGNTPSKREDDIIRRRQIINSDPIHDRNLSSRTKISTRRRTVSDLFPSDPLSSTSSKSSNMPKSIENIFPQNFPKFVIPKRPNSLENKTSSSSSRSSILDNCETDRSLLCNTPKKHKISGTKRRSTSSLGIREELALSSEKSKEHSDDGIIREMSLCKENTSIPYGELLEKMKTTPTTKKTIDFLAPLSDKTEAVAGFSKPSYCGIENSYDSVIVIRDKEKTSNNIIIRRRSGQDIRKEIKAARTISRRHSCHFEDMFVKEENGYEGSIPDHEINSPRNANTHSIADKKKTETNQINSFDLHTLDEESISPEREDKLDSPNTEIRKENSNDSIDLQDIDIDKIFPSQVEENVITLEISSTENTPERRENSQSSTIKLEEKYKAKDIEKGVLDNPAVQILTTDQAVLAVKKNFISLLYIFLQYRKMLLQTECKEMLGLFSDVNVKKQYFHKRYSSDLNLMYEMLTTIKVNYFSVSQFFNLIMKLLHDEFETHSEITEPVIILYLRRVIWVLTENFTSPSDEHYLFNCVTSCSSVEFLMTTNKKPSDVDNEMNKIFNGFSYIRGTEPGSGTKITVNIVANPVEILSSPDINQLSLPVITTQEKSSVKPNPLQKTRGRPKKRQIKVPSSDDSDSTVSNSSPRSTLLMNSILRNINQNKSYLHSNPPAEVEKNCTENAVNKIIESPNSESPKQYLKLVNQDSLKIHKKSQCQQETAGKNTAKSGVQTSQVISNLSEYLQINPKEQSSIGNTQPSTIISGNGLPDSDCEIIEMNVAVSNIHSSYSATAPKGINNNRMDRIVAPIGTIDNTVARNETSSTTANQIFNQNHVLQHNISQLNTAAQRSFQYSDIFQRSPVNLTQQMAQGNITYPNVSQNYTATKNSNSAVRAPEQFDSNYQNSAIRAARLQDPTVQSMTQNMAPTSNASGNNQSESSLPLLAQMISDRNKKTIIGNLTSTSKSTPIPETDSQISNMSQPGSTNETNRDDFSINLAQLLSDQNRNKMLSDRNEGRIIGNLTSSSKNAVIPETDSQNMSEPGSTNGRNHPLSLAQLLSDPNSNKSFLTQNQSCPIQVTNPVQHSVSQMNQHHSGAPNISTTQNMFHHNTPSGTYPMSYQNMPRPAQIGSSTSFFPNMVPGPQYPGMQFPQTLQYSRNQSQTVGLTHPMPPSNSQIMPQIPNNQTRATRNMTQTPDTIPQNKAQMAQNVTRYRENMPPNYAQNLSQRVQTVSPNVRQNVTQHPENVTYPGPQTCVELPQQASSNILPHLGSSPYVGYKQIPSNTIHYKSAPNLPIYPAGTNHPYNTQYYIDPNQMQQKIPQSFEPSLNALNIAATLRMREIQKRIVQRMHYSMVQNKDQPVPKNSSAPTKEQYDEMLRLVSLRAYNQGVLDQRSIDKHMNQYGQPTTQNQKTPEDQSTEARKTRRQKQSSTNPTTPEASAPQQPNLEVPLHSAGPLREDPVARLQKGIAKRVSKEKEILPNPNITVAQGILRNVSRDSGYLSPTDVANRSPGGFPCSKCFEPSCFVCSNCETYYCSGECQRLAWPEHQTQCSKNNTKIIKKIFPFQRT